MNHRKQTHKFGNAKNVRKRTSFAHSCIICNGKKYRMLKNIRDGKICAKNGMKIAAHKTYLVYAAFWCSENCAAKCWKQKWHKSGAARLGSGFCAIYVVIYLRQYRIILSADTASEVRQMLNQKSADNTGCCKGERRQWRETANRSRGQQSQSVRGFCPRSTMRVPQPDIIEHFGNADAVPQLPERC